jgi:hypothetical protein
MRNIENDVDHGVLPDGRPWVRASALKRYSDVRDPTGAAEEMLKRFEEFCNAPKRREQPMSKIEVTQAEIEIAKAIIAQLNKRKGTALMKHVRAALAPGYGDPVAEIQKLNASNERSPSAYADLMKQVAARDAAGVEMAKGNVPKARLDMPDGGSDDGDDDMPLSEKIAAYMEERGMDASQFDLAATAVLQQELKRHGLVGQGYGENTNPKPGIQPVEQA